MARSIFVRRAASHVLLLFPTAFAACSSSPSSAASPSAAAPAPVTRRAIVVSFDAMNERRMRETVDPAAVPNLRALFDGGACADAARPAFPSVTSPGHASLWTGAYGDVNGVAANSEPVLPQDEHTLLESISGYSSDALRAEPIWLAAAASGRSVYGHHVTQAPGAPAYRPIQSASPAPWLDPARAAAASRLALPTTQVVNGYNREIAPNVALTERTAPPRPAIGWRGVETLHSGVRPLEIAWPVGDDSLHALLYGASSYDRVLVARTRDVSGGVAAAAAPVERSPAVGRELARWFSAPLELPVDGGRVYVRARLFELAPDGSHYLLFLPELDMVEGNRPEVAAAYDRAVQGWYGNGASWMVESGELGAPLWKGGDGTAELRYLETAELVTRQFERGSAWAWTVQRPVLQLDYFPLVDEVDHMLYGHVVQASPLYRREVAARVQEIRARGWSLADHRLAALRALVGDDPAAALFVSGDHGMRATWRTFRPNAALAAAGLLTVGSNGRIDLSRTKALSPNGYWVMVNRTAWKGGIVPPAEERAVLAAAETALRGARSDDGQPVVTRIWRPSDGDTLGMGGPVGGDLYYEVADGYRWTTDPRGTVTETGPAGAGHGYPSVAPDMQTVFCASGAAFRPHRIGQARTIDVSPTVAEWVGIRAPAQAVGRSRLGELRR